MNETASISGPSSLRDWRASPPRSGTHRLIGPWEYRHLPAAGLARIADGGAATAAGFVCLSYGADGYAALFLVTAALNVASGTWLLTVAQSEPAPA